MECFEKTNEDRPVRSRALPLMDRQMSADAEREARKAVARFPKGSALRDGPSSEKRSRTS